MYMGRGLGFFESFPFLRIWKEAVGLRGPCFAFLGRFSPLIRVPLIMIPDTWNKLCPNFLNLKRCYSRIAVVRKDLIRSAR